MTEMEHTKTLEADHFHSDADHWPTVVHHTANEERKRDALKFENCANFPELYNDSIGWFFGSWDAAPQTAMEITGRMSQKDSEWLSTVAKI